MRRWLVIAAYALGGFVLAVAMAWAGFAVAGQRLSTPANPIEPVVVAVSPSASDTKGGTKPSPSKADDHHESPSVAFVPPTTSAAATPTAEPSPSGSDDKKNGSPDSGKGDD